VNDAELVAENPAGGLYDGFEAYRTPTGEDYRRLLTNGLVIPDTNVLLNLYRYHDQTRDDLLSVLEALGERLWVPHQVMAEFWGSRDGVLKDPRSTEDVIGELRKHGNQAENSLRAWANKVGLPDRRKDEMVDVLAGAIATVIERVREYAGDDAAEFARDTNNDPVLARLRTIVEGRVGPPLSDADHREAVKEAERRAKDKTPPGYMDAAKGNANAAGDYLVWVQTLREARRRRTDVLLVTADLKEDWWRRPQGQLRGPRPELVAEMRREAQAGLFMLPPKDLLVRARQILQIEVRDESLDNVEHIDSALNDPQDGGWTVEALSELLTRLVAEGWEAQAAVIREAGLRGGFVDRDSVYELGGFDESRTLRNFTGPIARIATDLRGEGLLISSAVDLLRADYPPGDDAGRASGFRVPTQLIPILQQVAMNTPTSGRYHVVDAKPYDARDHREGSVGRSGLCSLHGCGDPAIATMVGRDRGGRDSTLAVCERGVEEYDLRSRYPV
jgi:hypothetical protein